MENEALKEEMELLLSDKEVTLGDKKIIVHKISLIDSIKMTSYLSNIVSKLMNDFDGVAQALAKLTIGEDNDKEAMQIRAVGAVELLAFIGEDSADFISNLIAKTTNVPEDEIGNISAEDGIDLLFDIYEVNKSFFTKFMSKLQKKAGKKKGAKKTK